MYIRTQFRAAVVITPPPVVAGAGAASATASGAAGAGTAGAGAASRSGGPSKAGGAKGGPPVAAGARAVPRPSLLLSSVKTAPGGSLLRRDGLCAACTSAPVYVSTMSCTIYPYCSPGCRVLLGLPEEVPVEPGSVVSAAGAASGAAIASLTPAGSSTTPAAGPAALSVTASPAAVKGPASPSGTPSLKDRTPRGSSTAGFGRGSGVGAGSSLGKAVPGTPKGSAPAASSLLRPSPVKGAR